MPGFTNYSMSLPQEAIEPESRKHYIENLDFNSVQKIDVTMPDTPKEVEEILDKVKQRIEEAKNTPPKE